MLNVMLIERKQMRKTLLVLAVIALTFAVSGCLDNTLRGVGGVLRGVGQTVAGVGEDMTEAVDGYAANRR